jgi:hypothetical protein
LERMAEQRKYRIQKAVVLSECVNDFGAHGLYLELYDGRFSLTIRSAALLCYQIVLLLVYFLNSCNVHLIDDSFYIRIEALVGWYGVLGELKNIQTLIINVYHLDYITIEVRATSQYERTSQAN